MRHLMNAAVMVVVLLIVFGWVIELLRPKVTLIIIGAIIVLCVKHVARARTL